MSMEECARRESLFTLLFLAVWLTFWTLCGVIELRLFLAGAGLLLRWISVDDAGSLGWVGPAEVGTLLFLLVWLLGWAFGEVLALGVLLAAMREGIGVLVCSARRILLARWARGT
jgi:hypothetical protein